MGWNETVDGVEGFWWKVLGGLEVAVRLGC